MLSLVSFARSSSGFGAAPAPALAGHTGSSDTDISRFNPQFFVSRVVDGTMTGAFNPEGFTGPQVRRLVAQLCTGALSGFKTQPRQDGLAGFSATSAAWRSGARSVEFQRAEGSSVVIEITGSDSAGNPVFDWIDASI